VSRCCTRLAATDQVTLAAAAVSLLTATTTFVVASTVFTHHSVNHDEAVYLTQAAMLLSGRLELVAGGLTEAFRPWFFVQDGGRLYPKYTPVPAAMYAISMALVGEPRVTLAVVAGANTALVYVLGGLVFDRRVGLVAAILFAASPLALVTGATFLPYAPTTALNLTFAVAYLRGIRDGSHKMAGVAGVAIGLAFFARPYTAVLFATPFILHALVRVASVLRERGIRPLPGPVRRHGLTALFGMLFVGITLAYNLRLTGSPLTFPYQVFAPMDGPGFGERQILGHRETYTPALALRSNVYGVWFLFTRWVAAGPLGTFFAVVGGGLAVRRWVDYGLPAGDTERIGGLLLVGVAGSVVVGNGFFWGTHNLLATLSDPTDGLVASLGPFYHFDLLVPFAVFGGVAVVAGWETRDVARRRLSAVVSPQRARAVVSVGLAVAVLVGVVAGAAVVSTPLERNAAQTAKYEAAYEPFASTDLSDALVFLPTPYGSWQHHPFQSLRNEPDLAGDVVYALDRGPEGDVAALEAYPNRTAYRYTYRGEWVPDPTRHVEPTLEPLAVRTGDRLEATTTVGVPGRVDRARVRLETADGDDTMRYTVSSPNETVAVGWALDGDTARLLDDPTAMGVTNSPSGSVSLDETDLLVVTVTLVQPDGSTLTYRQEATVRTDGDRVSVVWPPERSVCRLVTDCGTEGTYLPDDPDAHPPWVVFETRITAEDV